MSYEIAKRPQENPALKNQWEALKRTAWACAVIATLYTGGSAYAAADPVIAHACAVTMGFGDGTVQYADCVGSLETAKAGEGK